MGAQSPGAYIAGAEAWIESDCTGEVPIVVGSDAKAQSDIYSAITLAGAIETDCVILAGARDGDMAAAQRARLDAANSIGYVIGGEAAVPTAKFSKPGRQLQRIGGTDRWATAQQVGAIAASSDPTKIADPPSKSGSVEVQSAGAHISGAEGWFSSDCTAAIPIIVGSDAAAQSDIYSAISLAGVVGTNCVILAGARNSDITEAQSQRLKAAAPGGFIIGGTASVPDTKINKPNIVRIAGADRWTTAHLVGQRADGFTAISASSDFFCALSTNGKVACWGDNRFGQTDVPDGTFTAITASSQHACALRTNGKVACWGANDAAQTDVPDGTYTVISGGTAHACGLRTNGKVTCWGDNRFGQTDAPDGTYTAISGAGTHSCALHINGTPICWGDNQSGETDAPDGTYTAISGAAAHSCALHINGTLACWGSNRQGQTDVPEGTYIAISAAYNHTCAIRTNGKVACWGANEYGAPKGVFIAIAAGVNFDAEDQYLGGYACTLRVNGQLSCWGAAPR